VDFDEGVESYALCGALAGHGSKFHDPLTEHKVQAANRRGKLRG
jgi:hypothetical protein